MYTMFVLMIIAVIVIYSKDVFYYNESSVSPVKAFVFKEVQEFPVIRTVEFT